MDTTTATFTVAYNERKGTYEIHAHGCKHLIARHLDVMPGAYIFATGAEAKADFEDDNEGCYAKLGPCAK